eukprot:CAMPEP_0114605786 /NCGR_PEP_ID=MMETSP0168-20121206/1232_1 /TAXON_ID=95228 ORGANISM="Vannella sp., Strain DIVA3 517/6/12" /NCGR_SAMPLE_ID=MMETSP0168 /ASSEMBLY_ACC=CAM_ASM_000044 /LENGTH=603 /DNA_ID=CAMNT_0001816643 /DNA_START=15 /DNA_END=1828 /DNA_ORIENTATION=+
MAKKRRGKRQSGCKVVVATPKRSDAEKRIEAALQADPVDVDVITAEARANALPDALRSRAWMALLRLRDDEIVDPEAALARDGYHDELDQVEKDVERSMWRWGTCEHEYHDRIAYRERLTVEMNAVLCLHRELHYYQGYHDIATVLLMCTEDTRLAFGMLRRLSLSYLREHMRPTLQEVMKELALLFPLLKCVDPELEEVFQSCSLAPFFALSWVLTWFSHDFTVPSTLLRLFDLFLSSHPLMPLYFGVALIVYRREEILKEERDFSMLHSKLSKVPRDLEGKVVDMLIKRAQGFFARYPPARLLRGMEDVSSDAMYLQYPYDWMANSEHFKCSGRLEESGSGGGEVLGISVNTLLVASVVVVGAVAVYALQSDVKSSKPLSITRCLVQLGGCLASLYMNKGGKARKEGRLVNRRSGLERCAKHTIALGYLHVHTCGREGRENGRIAGSLCLQKWSDAASICGVRVRTSLQQSLSKLELSEGGSKVQGRLLVFVGGVRIGSATQKKVDNAAAAVPHCKVERGVSNFVACVNVGASTDEQASRVVVAVAHREVKRRLSRERLRIHVGAAHDKHVCDTFKPHPSSNVERGQAVEVLQPGVGTGAQ